MSVKRPATAEASAWSSPWIELKPAFRFYKVELPRMPVIGGISQFVGREMLGTPEMRLIFACGMISILRQDMGSKHCYLKMPMYLVPMAPDILDFKLCRITGKERLMVELEFHDSEATRAKWEQLHSVIKWMLKVYPGR